MKYKCKKCGYCDDLSNFTYYQCPKCGQLVSGILDLKETREAQP